MKTTYKALAYVAGVELLELGNFETEKEAREALLMFYTDSFTFDIDEYGLSSSRIEKIDWHEYKCSFQGKKINCIDWFDLIHETIYSEKVLNEKELLENLSERYSEVINLKCDQLSINKKISYEQLFEYKCHDCGTNFNVYSVKVNNELNYDLCGECLSERESEAEKENDYDEE